MNKFEKTQSICDDDITKFYCLNLVLYLFVQKRTLFFLANTLHALELTTGYGNHKTLISARLKRARATPRVPARGNKNLLATVANLNNLWKFFSVILKEGRIKLETKHLHENSICGLYKTRYLLFQVKTLDSSSSRFFRLICMPEKLTGIMAAWIDLVSLLQTLIYFRLFAWPAEIVQ